MNRNEIFEEYTKATSKSRFVKDKAAELGVKESDIICELLKSGYKFEELKRANKGVYNAGMNKFKKWQENGSPEDEDADALAQYAEPESSSSENAAEQVEDEKPEYEYPATDEGEPEQNTVTGEDLIQIQSRTIAELKYRNDKLEVKLKSLASENVELKAENSKLEKDIEIQNGRIEDLDKRKKQFMARINELEADNQMLSKQYAELEMMSKKIEKDAAIDAADLRSEQEHLDKVYQENEKLKKQLEKAERYILNTIYAQSEDGDQK